ncbi:hypothetical protein [Nocardioides piscis]|uniref:Uncharacterized protein n=1 Tax=Nocardioides piscis TaxID=2714938 RepID=A0A6G7YIS9_9ACTN|nr:hypothetical protein [Nocardioides piscis]QIK76645.1 hypothetical protein G7071_15655 [Nocardioides piscis]
MRWTTRDGRQPAVRGVAAASALFWGLLFFGVIDLLVPVQETFGFHEAYLLETGWGVLYTFLVSAAFVVLVVRPTLVMPVVQLAIVAASLAGTAVAAGSWIQLAPAVLLALSCWAVVALAHGRPRHLVVRRSRRPDPWVGVLAVGSVPPAVLFAVDMVAGFRQRRPPLDDDTWGIDHWPTQAAMALAVAAAAVAVAVGIRARWSGAAASAGCVAVAAGWFGYWSGAYPGHAGSAGEAGGLALIGWAVAFVVVVSWRLVVRAGEAGPRGGVVADPVALSRSSRSRRPPASAE